MTAKIPDHLPSGPEWEASNEHVITASCADEIAGVLCKYAHSLTLAARIGIVETVKHEMILRAIQRADMEEDDDE